MDRPVESVREVFIDAIKGGPRDHFAVEVFARIGQSLSAIHSGLDLSSSASWRIPRDAELPNDNSAVSTIDGVYPDGAVFLHGDFGFSNIFVFRDDDAEQEQPELWVIDPSPNYFMTSRPDIKSAPEIDIANLAACMHGLIPVARQFSCDWTRANELIETFVVAYQEHSSRIVDRGLLGSLVSLTLTQYMQTRVKEPVSRWLVHKLLNRRVLGSGVYREKL
jgi:hypothetical protein